MNTAEIPFKALEFAGRMIAAMRVTFVSQVSETVCAMFAVSVCVSVIRVCVCVCYVLGYGYELVHMYQGQHRA